MLAEFFKNSVFFGVTLSLLAYGIGVWLKNKFKLGLFNPLLISIIVTIIFLVSMKIEYKSYYDVAKYISFLLLQRFV